MDDLSREELYSVISRLKRENSCLKTVLIRFELHLNYFYEYFDYFNEMNEKITSNNEILVLINRIKALKYFNENCFVSVENLAKNESNLLGHNSCQTSTKIDVKSRDKSTDSIINSENNFTSNHITNQQIMKNEIQREISEEKEVVFNESQFEIKGIRSVKTSVETEDNCSDFDANEEQINENSDEVLETTPSEVDQMTNERNISENSHQLSPEKVSESIDSNIKWNNKSNKGIINEIIMKYSQTNGFNTQTLIESTENTDNNQNKDSNKKTNHSKEETPKQSIRENEVQIKNNSEITLIEYKTSVESEDTEIESNDTSDEEISDNYDEEINEEFNYYTERSKQKTHKEELHSRGKFKCEWEDCNRVFAVKSNLDRHYIEVHSSDVNKYIFKCNWKDCNKSFVYKGYLDRHIAIHEGLYRCTHEGCQHIAKTSTDLKTHLITHSKDRQFVCLINGCNKAIKTKTNLSEHQLRAHPQQFKDMPWIECSQNDCNFKTKSRKTSIKHEKVHTRPYVCSKCNKSFSSSRNLKHHLTTKCVTKHKGSKLKGSRDVTKFKCQWKDCNKSFAVKQSLNRHMALHKGVYPCTVEGCQYIANSSQHLSSHMAIHSNERPFVCLINDCNKTFKLQKGLRKHQLQTHPQQFKDKPWIECSQNGCNFKTKYKNGFDNHQKVHTLPYVCSYCDKRFSASTSLKTHLTTHLNELRIRCEWFGCQRSFLNRVRMKDHMNTHTLEKSYSCQWPNCGKIFSTKTLVSSHYTKHKEKGLYNCPHCSYITKNAILFKNHKKKHEN